MRVGWPVQLCVTKCIPVPQGRRDFLAPPIGTGDYLTEIDWIFQSEDGQRLAEGFAFIELALSHPIKPLRAGIALLTH